MRLSEARMKDWPVPKSRAELLAFLNFTGFYRDHIWDYARHIKPLTNILAKDGGFEWGEREQGTFDEIRNMLIIWMRRHSKSRMKAGDEDDEEGNRKPDQRNLQLDDAYSDEEAVPFPEIRAKNPRVRRERSQERRNDPLTGQNQKSYKLLAPIHKPGVTDSVVNRILDNTIEMTSREAMAISEQVAKGIKSNLTKTRQPLGQKATNAVMSQEALPYMDEVLDRLDWDALQTGNLPAVSFYVSTGVEPGVPSGSIIFPDPYEEYLNRLGPNEAPKQVYEAGQKIFTALDSGSLRVLFPLVGGKELVEAIIDNGSQIVSMALKVAVRLMLSWDPDIKILMESANGQLKATEGLARNVPFVFGDITVYLQVHIIDQPAYDILLGRPFDILTESQTRNYPDGGSTITIKDPNSNRRCELPTHARGARSIARSVPDEILRGRPPIKASLPGDSRNKEPLVQDFQTSSMNWG